MFERSYGGPAVDNLLCRVTPASALRWIGHIWKQTESIDLLSGFVQLDTLDQQDVLQAIESEFPGYRVNVYKPIPKEHLK